MMSERLVPYTSTTIDLLGVQLKLLPDRAIYWPEKKSIIIADVHLGKAMHFRRSGIAVPDHVCEQDLGRLETLIRITQPDTVIFLGDLFHSFHNPSWELFGAFRRVFSDKRFVLVEGNHDILSDRQFEKFGIEVIRQLREGPFLLTHEPIFDTGQYNLCGHIHPGVRLVGTARQALRLPCFYFGKKGGILPAFGGFTGCARISVQSGERVYVISDGEVVNVSR